MTNTNLMTIKIKGEIMIADVSFHEGFVFIEDVKHCFIPILTEVRKKTGWFDDNTEAVWVEDINNNFYPVVYPAEDLCWAYFGKDLSKAPRKIMYMEEYTKVRKELGFEK